MLREERWNQLENVLQHAADDLQSRIWTSLPVIVVSYNPATQTAVVQSAIQGRQRSPDGTWSNVTLPPFVDVPVKHPSAGGLTITLPISEGDEGSVVFAARSIDGWFANGGVQPQTDYRMHDLSDAMFHPGGRSQARKLANVSATTAQIRSDDGTMVVDFDPVGKKITITSPNPTVLNGDLHVTGEIISGFGTGDQVAVLTHEHSGVAMGTADSGPPVAGT